MFYICPPSPFLPNMSNSLQTNCCLQTLTIYSWLCLPLSTSLTPQWMITIQGVIDWTRLSRSQTHTGIVAR